MGKFKFTQNKEVLQDAITNAINDHDKVEDLEKTKNYTHVQEEPSKEWNITHNLGFFPNVTVIDSEGALCIGELVYVGKNIIKITFSAEMTGTAYCS